MSNTMSDNQYTIQIGTDADSSSVEELAAKIQEATGSADELTSSLSGAGESAENLSYTLSNSNGEVFEMVADSANDAAGALGGVGDAANNAGAGVKGIPSEPVKEVAKGSKEASEGLKEGAGAADMMGAALSAIVGLGIATLMYDLADAAGAYEESWDRIALLTTGTTENMEAVEEHWNGSINTMKEHTGRGAGVIRAHIQAMSIAGVTDTNAITSAFEGLAGRSYATGLDLGNMETALQRTIQTGIISGRTLMQLGISQSDVFKATGMSMEELSGKWKTMTADQRAQVMSQILNNDMAKESNEAYKESWAYVQDQAGLAWDYLKRVVGEVVLPILIPAITFLTNMLKILGDWFSKLDGPTKFWIGALIVLFGVLGIGAAAILTLIGIMNLLGIGTAIGTAITIARAIATYGLIAAQWLWATATYAVTAAQWALNLAMSLNPIGVVIIAVIALIAILYYLWSTNEGFRNALIGAWAAISGAFRNGGQSIYGTLMQIWNAIVWVFVGLPRQMYQWGANAIQSFINGIINAIPGLRWALDKIAGFFPHSPPKEGPLATITTSNMYDWMADIASAGVNGFSSFSLSPVPMPSISGYGSASLGFDATEINASLDKNTDANGSKKIIQYNTINQEGIMGPKQAADFAVKAVTDKLEEENLITGKTKTE